tara:strand:- start:21695 stop:22807 length:1113 start_codon:yes stop_codon:yes gene_type:complete
MGVPFLKKRDSSLSLGYHATMTDLLGFTPRKILACQLRQIGDVLLSTPAYKLLKQRYPDAELHVLTEKKCVSVLENNPHIDHVWAIDKKELSNPLKAVAWYARVGRQGYDLIVDFQQLPRCKWVVGLSNAPVRLSFTPPWYNKFLYTHWTEMESGYAAKAKASVLAPLGIEWDMDKPELFLTDQEKSDAEATLKQYGISGVPFITVDPSHRRKTRKWPARHYISLLKILEEQYPDMKAVILYGPGEKELADKINAEAGNNVLVFDEMLSLRQMAAVLDRAVMHLGNCSSPRHFAVAVDTPSVVIHGATSPAWRFPSDDHLSLARRPGCCFCNKKSCKLGTFECLVEYLPERVFSEFKEHLERCLVSWSDY